MRGAYAGSLALMGIGIGIAAVAPVLAVAVVGVVIGAVGNGAAVVSNALLVQRGAPDELRGRAFTVIMSSNYIVLGIAMVVAGALVDVYGGRWIFAAASIAFLLAARGPRRCSRRASGRRRSSRSRKWRPSRVCAWPACSGRSGISPPAFARATGALSRARSRWWRTATRSRSTSCASSTARPGAAS